MCYYFNNTLQSSSLREKREFPNEKKKKRREEKILLLDKSTLLLLNAEERKQLDSKHKILYPPILLAENARHGLDEPSALFDFKNTVSVIHWVQRAKMDLVKGETSRSYIVGAEKPALSIYGEPEAYRKEVERQAIHIVAEMEAEEEELKNHISLLRGEQAKLLQLVMNHRDIPDKNLLREFNREFNQSGQNHLLNLSASLIGGGSGSIATVRGILDNYRDRCEERCIVDTLEKAYRWVRQMIYRDTGSILRFLCKTAAIPLSADEQEEIFNRFEDEGKPHIDNFAPYARMATQLRLTIFLYLVENKENSSPRGALRDFEYLFYALDDNVTFVSSDAWHKKCIEEIPILGNVRKRFKFIVHKNKSEEEFKKGLRSLGIKV